VRAVGIPLYEAQARLRPGPPPRVLVNTMPKSGTHLATGLLRSLPHMRFSGVHLTAYDIARDGAVDVGVLHRRLERVRMGQFASAHLPADPAIVDAVDALGYRTLFLYRDPRDMAVSDLHYILAFDRHPMHAALTALSPSERLSAVINGLPGKRAGLPLLEPLADRCRAYRGWMARPGVLCVRFEDLVGSQGGGDDARQRAAVAAVAAHVDRPLSSAQAQRVADSLWSPRSSTFRRGLVHGWRSEFTEAETALLKTVMGDDLMAMGYEDDDDW
jgi:sulfotransferase 6B1